MIIDTDDCDGAMSLLKLAVCAFCTESGLLGVPQIEYACATIPYGRVFVPYIGHC